ncbi:MAG TPA: OAM dimerization domain-containing protein, partial [Clostridiaceae bacterium]|nr:OAM dimerization domain-containing protein [Clostridiaceae bacterium]
HVRPEVQWAGDGVVLQTMMLPLDADTAEAVAVEIGKKMGLLDVEVVHKQVMQKAEGTLVEIKGRVDFDIDATKLTIPKKPVLLSDEEIREDVQRKPLKIVAGTLGNDEHSVGLREIIDIKHGGIEKYGIECIYLGTSVPVEKLVDAAIEAHADAVLASTIISHDNIHYKNMRKLVDIATEKGARDRLILIGGGTQVVRELAEETGIDAGFGRGTKGIDVATFLVKKRWEKEGIVREGQSAE